MRYNKTQWILIASSLALLLIMYAFGRTKPKLRQGEAEAVSSSTLSKEIILQEQIAKLDSTKLAWWQELETQRKEAPDLVQQAEVLKLMSRTWNEWENFACGAIFAAQVAELTQSAEAWAIAGTSYGIAYQRSEDLELRKFAARKSIAAFEQAAALEPDSLRHRLNEAVMWIDLADVDPSVMPMEGVRRLQALEEQYPKSVQLYLTLGRLSFARTGDVEKGIPRLEKILTLAKEQEVDKGILLECHYYLAQGYEKLKQPEKALEHYESGMALAEDPDLRKQFQELSSQIRE